MNYITTPLELNEHTSNKYNCNVYFKREDLQITNSFKIRGASNAIIKKNPKHVVTCSAGNHAQGILETCIKLNIPCTIFIPTTTPLQKQTKIENYKNKLSDENKFMITIVKTQNTFDDCLKEALAFCNLNPQNTFIHPFDDIDVVNGHSSISQEITDIINPDFIICSIGGGGLVAGQLLYRSNMNNKHKYKIIGIEPVNANGMEISLKNNKLTELQNVDVFVDGCAVKRIGNLTFDICSNNESKLDDIIIVTKEQLCKTMIELHNFSNIKTEPAGALSVACLDQLSQQYDLKNKNVVCIISGGNHDSNRNCEIENIASIEQTLKFN